MTSRATSRHKQVACGGYVHVYYIPTGGELAPSLGGREKNFADKIFEWLFWEKFPFRRRKFRMTFLSSTIFCLFFPVSTVNLILCNIHVCDPFLAEKPLFRTKHFFLTLFLVSSYFATHPTTLLLEILGDECTGRPPTSKFGGAVPPQYPLSLRPCIYPPGW